MIKISMLKVILLFTGKTKKTEAFEPTKNIAKLLKQLKHYS